MSIPKNKVLAALALVEEAAPEVAGALGGPMAEAVAEAVVGVARAITGVAGDSEHPHHLTAIRNYDRNAQAFAAGVHAHPAVRDALRQQHRAVTETHRAHADQ